MYIIRKEFHFSASHLLYGLSPEHPCGRMHGHNYVVTVELRTRLLDQVGMVRDYRELEPIKKFIDENLDHRHLNDIIPGNPTAERIAEYLYKTFQIDFLYAVEVSETPKTTARFEPND